MRRDLSEFYGAFFDEAEELLQEMEVQLLTFDLVHPNHDILDAVFRAIHSIKAGAAAFGIFDQLVQTTHSLESVLVEIRGRTLPLSRATVDALIRGKDTLTDQVCAYREGRQPEAEFARRLMQDLDYLLSGRANATQRGAASALVTSDSVEQAAIAEAKTILRLTAVRVSESDRLSLQGELERVGDILSQRVDQDACVYDFLTDLDAQTVRAICGFVIDDEQLEIIQQPTPGTATSASRDEHTLVLPTANHSIRVAIKRLDQLIDQVDEVVSNHVMLSHAYQQSDSTEHADICNEMARMTEALRCLQKSIRTLRQVSMASVLNRYHRMVRDIAAKLNKRVNLHIACAIREIDKEWAEKLIDPLTHVIRNSLDHGIETPDVRLAKGKPPTGRLTIGVFHHDGRIVVEVTDDGAGMNRERILTKARLLNLPASYAMTDHEVFQLVFAPGLSTAEVVTEVSGRGVGMDVVRRNIEHIGGQIQIDSRPNIGTTLRILLPQQLDQTAVSEGQKRNEAVGQ